MCTRCCQDPDLSEGHSWECTLKLTSSFILVPAFLSIFTRRLQAADFLDDQASLKKLSEHTAVWLFGGSEGRPQGSLPGHELCTASPDLSDDKLQVRLCCLWLPISALLYCPLDSTSATSYCNCHWFRASLRPLYLCARDLQADFVA